MWETCVPPAPHRDRGARGRRKALEGDRFEGGAFQQRGYLGKVEESSTKKKREERTEKKKKKDVENKYEKHDEEKCKTDRKKHTARYW
jgi:hypothetical protein